MSDVESAPLDSKEAWLGAMQRAHAARVPAITAARAVRAHRPTPDAPPAFDAPTTERVSSLIAQLVCDALLLVD